MILQNIKYLFILLLAESKGIFLYVWQNLQGLMFPVFTMFFILDFIPVEEKFRRQHLLYVYMIVVYIIFTTSFPRKIGSWFYSQKQRGTIETIALTRLGILGTVTYLFCLHLMLFFLVELPLFVIIAKYFLGIDVLAHWDTFMGLFIAINLFLSYGLTVWQVAVYALFDLSVFSISSKRVMFNFLAGAYVPVSCFPWWIKIFSLLLPFTYGAILLDKIVFKIETVTVSDFSFFCAICFLVFVTGLWAFHLIQRYVLVNKSFRTY